MPNPTYGDLPVAIDPTAWNGRTITPPAGSLTIDTLQNAIQATLQAAFTAASLSISTYVFPNFDLDTWWKSSDIAFVLITYKGTKFTSPESTSAMVQGVTRLFKVHIEARTKCWALSGAGSVYALIDAIEACLTGIQITGCRRSYFTDEEFSEQSPEGDVWIYDLTYNVLTQKVMQLPQYTLADLARIVNNITPSGDVVIVEADEDPPLSG